MTYNKFSIICVSNNITTFNEMLKPSILKQNYDNYEIIYVDSVALKFDRASSALNYGASIASGDILIFCHHDIELSNIDFLTKLNEYCNNYEFGIAGLAGVINQKKWQVTSSVTIGPKHINAGIKNDEVREIKGIDECLFIIKKKDFRPFPDLGKTWHFYSVEYSMYKESINQKVILFPLPIYHLSVGWSLNENYFDTLKVVCKKYKNVKVIKTCMGDFNNNLFLPLYCLYRKTKIKLKKLLKIKEPIE